MAFDAEKALQRINQSINTQYYYSYRAFGGQNKILYSTLCDKDSNNFIIARAIICDLNSAQRCSPYTWAHSVRAVCKQTKWQPAVTHDRKMTHKALYK